jgi:hypothetical protein
VVNSFSLAAAHARPAQILLETSYILWKPWRFDIV